ncbi:MAG: hypothetical protein IJW50_08315 [Clostridia bacterium]|nr:hypothetical protein [Clostridia bacterium]
MRKVKGGSCKNSPFYLSVPAGARTVSFCRPVCDKPDAKRKNLAECASFRWYQ